VIPWRDAAVKIISVILTLLREAVVSTTEDRGSGPGGQAVQQAPALTRTDLQRQDLSVPGREVVQWRVDIGPEAPLVKHTIPVRQPITRTARAEG
jgi:hypothetical protein